MSLEEGSSTCQLGIKPHPGRRSGDKGSFGKERARRARFDTARGTPVLFPERLEQDPNVQKAEEGNADTASNGGLTRQQPDLNRTGSALLLY